MLDPLSTRVYAYAAAQTWQVASKGGKLMDIQNKQVLVLGGAGLAGAAVCAALVREGAATVLAYQETYAASRGVRRLIDEHKFDELPAAAESLLCTQ